MAKLGKTWLSLHKLDQPLPNFAYLGLTLPNLAKLDCFCPFLSVSVSFCQFLSVFVRFCLFLSVSVCFCLFLSVYKLFNRSGVDGAVLQSKYLQKNIPNGKSQGAELLRECSSHTMCHVSHVMCHLSPVTCILSYVKKYIYLKKIFKKNNWLTWWSQSLEGLLSTGPTPSSFQSCPKYYQICS